MLSSMTLMYQRTQSPILPPLLKQTLAEQNLFFSRTDSQMYASRYRKYKGHVVSLSVSYKEAHEISSLPGVTIQSHLFRRLNWELRASLSSHQKPYQNQKGKKLAV